MKTAIGALLFVVFLDTMNQGLVIPILNTVIMDPNQGFMPAGTSVAERQVNFGIAMGVFYFAWFLGAAYISNISDSIGRKQGILICLTGNLFGYALTIFALETSSFALLVAARAISGFSAGNQPIAQAALVDMSENDDQKTRFMGLILFSLSMGLIAGPLVGGLLSDKSLLGADASLELPFYVVSCLVIVCIFLIAFFFHNQQRELRPFQFKPFEVFLTLWYAAKRPVIVKLSLVFFFAQLGLNAFYVFMANYFYSRFGFDTLQNAYALVVFGASMGIASAFLVAPLNRRYGKYGIVCFCLVAMALSAALSIANSSVLLAYLLIIPLTIPFAIYYPTTLTLYSAAVDDSEQGWVMGVTIALFTLGTGLISIIGGKLIAIDIHLPFVVAVVSNLVALLFAVLLWRGKDIRALYRQ